RRAGARGETRSLLRRGRRLSFTIGVGRGIVVGAFGDRDPPEAHRADWVEARGLPERPLCLEMVECIDEAQALVEPALSLGRTRRDPIRGAAGCGVGHWAADVCARPVGDGL